MTRGTRHESSSTPARSTAEGEPNTGLVPSRRQYLDLKSQHPDAILLYRLGDFYESFDDDAKVVARDARITLTSRSFGRSGRVPMAGIPHHALNHYLGRLLAHGHTVAIAEQLSEPGRGLVERAVTRVLTPGTVSESALLPAGESRYLAAIYPRLDHVGLAWVDVSTGEFATMELSGPQADVTLAEELARLGPAECLVPDDAQPGLPATAHKTRLERWNFEPDRARSALRDQFGTTSLAPYGCADLPTATGAAGAIIGYLTRTNPNLLRTITGLRTESYVHRVGLDAATRRNLELAHSFRTGGTRGSLLGVLDLTRTSMGARALRRLVGQPLCDLGQLQRRQAIVAAFVACASARASLSASLAGVGDLERLAGRLAQGSAGARDFLALASALRSLPAILAGLRSVGEPALTALAELIDPCADVAEAIELAVEEDNGGVARIRQGFCVDRDAAVDGARDTRNWLAGLERHERERTGIRSLKVGYNKVFGYYIEVTTPNLHLVPDDYIRKQTIANGERYFTAALKEAEARVLAADEEIAALERAALERLRTTVVSATGRLLTMAGHLAHLDALLSLAEVADRWGWVAPVIEESEVLVIAGGRHPVVEASLGGDAFIPNDCRLGGANPRVLLVTGPNMGGKSTFLRQTALIVLLAQIGSFVPAREARVGLVDRIFTRVGAHDDLAGGASTFMVEMVETATILHQATHRSLLILDEVGRGTSTQDGLAIARAVLDDIHGRIRARTLFATHYLELTSLAHSLADVANVHVAALEAGDRVIFLYSVRPGAADRAYGIQVARLAGLPPWVADRAEQVLASLGSSAMDTSEAAAPENNSGRALGIRVAESGSPIYQLALDGLHSGPSAAERLTRALQEIDLTEMSPREAIDWLFEQQEKLRGGR